MKQITIYEFLEKHKDALIGYKFVSYDKGWWAYKEEPEAGDSCWIVEPINMACLSPFDSEIAPFDGDWKDSLIKIEGVK